MTETSGHYSRANVWTGQAMFPTRRNRLTGEPGSAKAFADLTLDEVGGRLDLLVVWLFSEPMREIEFRWEEVESVTRVRWFWFRTGVKFRLRRAVVENDWRRSLYFFTLGRHVSQILDFAGTNGVGVVRATERFILLWLDEGLGGRAGAGLNFRKLCDNGAASRAG